MSMTELSASNSLADLAARIKIEHEATASALRDSVAHAMAAGDLLIEAKAQLKHGQWLPWLQNNVDISERTAQLYMRLAKNRIEIEAAAKSATVADLTLRGALAVTAADRRLPEEIESETFTDFDFADHPGYPRWLQEKLARVVGLPKHVQVALAAMDDYDLPVLAMCSTEEITEALKLIAPYANKEDKPFAMATISISPFIAWVDLKIASQRILVALWHEVVDERKKLTAEQFYQRGHEVCEKLGAAVAAAQTARAN